MLSVTQCQALPVLSLPHCLHTPGSRPAQRWPQRQPWRSRHASCCRRSGPSGRGARRCRKRRPGHPVGPAAPAGGRGVGDPAPWMACRQGWHPLGIHQQSTSNTAVPPCTTQCPTSVCCRTAGAGWAPVAGRGEAVPAVVVAVEHRQRGRSVAFGAARRATARLDVKGRNGESEMPRGKGLESRDGRAATTPFRTSAAVETPSAAQCDSPVQLAGRKEAVERATIARCWFA